jgi:hypothetical protein
MGLDTAGCMMGRGLIRAAIERKTMWLSRGRSGDIPRAAQKCFAISAPPHGGCLTPNQSFPLAHWYGQSVDGVGCDSTQLRSANLRFAVGVFVAPQASPKNKEPSTLRTRQARQRRVTQLRRLRTQPSGRRDRVLLCRDALTAYCLLLTAIRRSCLSSFTALLLTYCPTSCFSLLASCFGTAHCGTGQVSRVPAALFRFSLLPTHRKREEAVESDRYPVRSQPLSAEPLCPYPHAGTQLS